MDKAISPDALSLSVQSIQTHFRTLRSATALLVSQYEQRLQWYADSRLSLLTRPLLPILSARRHELCLALDELAPEIARLDGTDSHLLSALKQLWATQGELQVIESVQGASMNLP